MSYKKECTKARKILLSSLVVSVCLPFIYLFWPSHIPFGIFEFWSTSGNLKQWIISSLPILAWGVVIATLYSGFTRNTHEYNEDAEVALEIGAYQSFFVSIIEEIVFRWVFFLGGIFGATIINLVTLGFAKWLFEAVLTPVADFTTFGLLHNMLYHPSGWVVGAGLLVANFIFADVHKYRGYLAFVNAWFAGLFFFWLLFEYGLFASILAHFLYNLLTDVVVYVDSVIERRFNLSVG